jgi:hypothetical protein
LTSEWQNKITNVNNVNSFQILPFAPALFLNPVKPSAVPNVSRILPNATLPSDPRNIAYFSESKVLVEQMEHDLQAVQNNDSSSIYVPELHPLILTYSVGGVSVLIFVLFVVSLVVLCQRRNNPQYSAPLPVTMPSVQYVPAAQIAMCPRDT